MRDLHVHVVHHDAEIIGGRTVGSRDDQIVELAVLKHDAAVHHVVDHHFTGERILEAHHGRHARERIGALAPTSVVARLFTACDLLSAHLLQFLLAAVAAIGFAAGEQLFDDVLVAVEALGLIKRTFVVIESRPFEAIQDLLDGLRRRALQIGILDPQDELAGMTPGVQPAKQCGPQATDVQETCGAGSKSGADGHGLIGKIAGRRV